MFPRLLLTFAIAVAVVASYTHPAHAKAKIPIPYHTGQDIFETGDIPAPHNENPELKGFKAGYKCDIWGVVWTYFTIKNCEPVVFKDDTYGDRAQAPELIAALEKAYTEDDMKVGVWTKHGRWILGGAVLLLIGVFFLPKSRNEEEDELDELDDDEISQETRQY